MLIRAAIFAHLVRIGAAGSICSVRANGLTGIGDVGILTMFKLTGPGGPGAIDIVGTDCFRPLRDDGREETSGDLNTTQCTSSSHTICIDLTDSLL